MAGVAGFDSLAYPGDAAMTWLLANTNLKWCGYYLAPAPSRSNSPWLGKCATLRTIGWGVVPIYVGQQAQGPGSHVVTAAQGTLDGADAAKLAASEGFPAGTTIFLDIEQGPPIAQAALDYYTSWVAAVWASQYYPGVYCSYLLGPQIAAADSRPVMWCFNINKFPNNKAVAAPYPEPDPSGCGVATASLWQLSQNVTIQIGGGKSQAVDLDVATTADPAQGQTKGSASSSDAGSSDSSSDGGTSSDAGSSDAGSSDSSSDAGSSDSSSDGGTSSDAGSSDSSSDAGSSDSSDGGTSSDAGSSDGGTSSDAGSSDSSSDAGSSDSSSDAGSSDSSSDGGTSSDAGSSDSSSDGGTSSSDGGASPSVAGAPVDYAKLVPIPAGINGGVSDAAQSTMMSLFGKPGDLTTDCSPITNATLKALIVTQNVGPFSVTGLKPAVDALTRIFAAMKAQKPALYAVLTTAGMTCCRAVRGSTTNYSNHSWGTAVDLGINGVLTPLGSTTVQQGMVEAAPFFNAERFFWGAGYHTRADGMHFEASNELLQSWKSDGTIP